MAGLDRTALLDDLRRRVSRLGRLAWQRMTALLSLCMAERKSATGAAA